MMNSNATIIVVVASFLLSGCTGSLVPEAQPDSSSTGVSESTGTGASEPSADTSGSPPEGTSVSDTTSGPALDTSSGAADSSSSSDSSSGLPVCLDEGTWRGAAISGPNPLGTEEWENVDATCLVRDFERGGGTSEYTLECDEGGPEPTVRTLYAPFISALDVGMTVRLRYLREIVIDGPSYRAFAIHDLEGALVVGNYRNHVPSDAPTDSATFFAPFEFDSVDGLCAPEPRRGDEGGSFVIDPCPFARTPLGVRVAFGDETTTIVDRTTRSVAGYEFNVSAYFADFVDPESGCGRDRDFVSVHVFSEQK